MSVLQAKLKAYGVQDSVVNLIQSYLSGRFQRVKCNGKVSDWLPIRCGVLQESLLGPLLFNIFVNDINYFSRWIFLPAFVCWWHDSMCSTRGPLYTWIHTESRHKEINPLVYYNYLQVNTPKTQAITMGKSQNRYKLFVGDMTIEIEQTLKIVGVTLGRDLFCISPCCKYAEKSVC